MIDSLTKKELKEQLKANQISFSIKNDENELRKLLSDAIENGKAELKNIDSGNTEKETIEEEIEVVEVVEIKDENATLLQCLRQFNGKMPFETED